MLRVIERVAIWVACAALAVPAFGAGADLAPDALVKQVTLEVLDIVRHDKEIQAGDHR